jgi:hypothetical protein
LLLKAQLHTSSWICDNLNDCAATPDRIHVYLSPLQQLPNNLLFDHLYSFEGYPFHIHTIDSRMNSLVITTDDITPEVYIHSPKSSFQHTHLTPAMGRVCLSSRTIPLRPKRRTHNPLRPRTLPHTDRSRQKRNRININHSTQRLQDLVLAGNPGHFPRPFQTCCMDDIHMVLPHSRPAINRRSERCAHHPGPGVAD